MKSYIQTYNPDWPDWYSDEAKRIKDSAPIAINLYHIGSTAITDMHAKPCIDILGEIESFQQGKKLIAPLEEAGFEYRGEYGIKGRHYFAKKSQRKVHLHIFTNGSKEVDKHLHYVNVMSKSPELVKEFIKIKQDLQTQYPDDKSRYQQEKSFFYEKIASINNSSSI